MANQEVISRAQSRYVLSYGPQGVGYRKTCDLPIPGAYADVTDIVDLVMPDNAKNDYSTHVLQRWLVVGASLINAKLGQRFTVPLKTVSELIVYINAEIALYGATGKRGYNPEGKSERTFDVRHHESLELLTAMQNYEITADPELILTEPARVATVVSEPSRGWNGHVKPYRGNRGGFF